MNTEELQELHEHAHNSADRKIGVTMAMTAAILAMVTMMGHRLHTEEVILETKAVDGWAFFQAKNGRSHLYATDARLAELTNHPAAPAVAEEWKRKAESEKSEAEKIRHETEEVAHEARLTARRATLFDTAEVALEIAIVLCSISLLTKTALYWHTSYGASAVGAALALYSLLLK